MRSIAELRTFILDEKITHGRTFDLSRLPQEVVDNIATAMVKKGISKTYNDAVTDIRTKVFDMSSDDVITSLIERELERYDERKDLYVLASKNITEAYNSMIAAHFEEALQSIKKCEDTLHRMKDAADTSNTKTEFTIKPVINATMNIASIYKEYIDTGIVDNEDEFKKHIMSQIFYESNDPIKLKSYLQARVQYNRMMIQTFQAMIKMNYRMLGMSSEKAEMLVQRLESDDQPTRHGAIRELKTYVMNNRNKFEKRKGFIDFRSIGGGVVYSTEEQTGMDKHASLSRLLQLSMKYDCIIFAHGGSNVVITDGKDAELKKKLERAAKIYDQANTKIAELDKQIVLIKRLYVKNVKPMTDKVDKISYDDTMLVIASDQRNQYMKRIKMLKSQLLDAEQTGDTELINMINKSLQGIMERLDDIDKEMNEIKAEIEQLGHDITEHDKHHVEVMRDRYDKINKILLEKSKKIKGLQDKIAYEYNVISDYIDHKYGNKEKRWTIQPIKTENAGPFTDVNDLVRQCIKEGYKRIYISACNPGKHKLDKDIRDHKGVTIHHAQNNVVTESADIIEIHDPEPLMESTFDVNDPLDWALQECYMMEQDAIQIARSCNIDYYELDESVIIDLNEGIADRAKMAAKGVWKALGILIAKTIKFVLYAIKKFKDFITGIIDRLKKFYEKRKGKFTEPVESNVIMVENASVITAKMNSWADLEKKAIESCEKMAIRIRAFNEDQLKCLKKMEEFADKKDRESNSTRTNESFTISDLRSLIYT